ncbi:MAG: NAD(P)-dependent oxidoreductase [Roseibium album]|uniref:NAD-dependent epimerase/dehydratase family protein n=1 Tax=Roseibium album TaxID=311410 RepID=UPI000D55ABDB
MRGVLVTGAGGFLGGHLMTRLLDQNIPAFALVRENASPETPRPYPTLHDRGDVLELAGELTRYDITDVIHLATSYAPDEAGPNALSVLNANILFGGRLLAASAAAGVTGFVNIGTFWQFAEDGSLGPNSLYAATKQAFSELVAYYANWQNLNALTLVLYDLYGPGDKRPKLLPELVSAAKTGKRIDTTAGYQKVVPTHVYDAVDAILVALEQVRGNKLPSNPDKFVHGGDALTVRELARLIESVSGKALNIDWGARPYRSNQIMDPYLGPRLSGWKPKINIAQGVEQLLREWDESTG